MHELIAVQYLISLLICVSFSTCASTFQISETHYMDVACHPIISIPAPHQKVLYSEVKPQNEKPVSDCS